MWYRKEKWFGRTLCDWSAALIHESSRDAINTEQVYTGLISDFNMNVDDSRSYFSLIIHRILESGAMVVNVGKHGEWVKSSEFTYKSHDEIVRIALLDENLISLSGLWLKTY